MTQNIITLAFTDPQLAALDDAITQVESQLVELVALSPAQKRTLPRMGEQSEVFCRQALRMAEQNPHIMPANVPLADAIADLKALDQLRPRLMRLARLTQRATDTEAALGSDVLAVALKAYAQLKLTGRSEGLEDVRRDLSARFAKQARRAGTPAA